MTTLQLSQTTVVGIQIRGTGYCTRQRLHCCIGNWGKCAQIASCCGFQAAKRKYHITDYFCGLKFLRFENLDTSFNYCELNFCILTWKTVMVHTCTRVCMCPNRVAGTPRISLKYLCEFYLCVPWFLHRIRRNNR